MTEDRPFVSVIVPVYNDPTGVRQCLEALCDQTYPTDRYEVVAVDNGSTDTTRDVIREFDDVKLLVEDEIQGSYAARNHGIRNAKGEIIAFTDADCTPKSNWLEAGVDEIVSGDADLAAGRILFEFSPERTAAERFDASVNMQNDESAKEGVAKTANLLVRREVADEIGTFPESLISGGDVYWTGTATDSGFNLTYVSDAIVVHETRKLPELVQKHFRVGRGQVQVWRLSERSMMAIVVESTLKYPFKMSAFLTDDPTSKTTADSTTQTITSNTPEKTIGVYLVAVVAVLSMIMGRTYELIA